MNGNLLNAGRWGLAGWLIGGLALLAQDFTPSAPPSRTTLGGSGSSDWSSNAPTSLMGPLELRMDDNIVALLRRDGAMQAPIAVQDAPNINQIIFGYQRPMSNYKNEGSFGLIEPIARSGGMLVFEFRESDLLKIQDSTLRYNLSREEIGRYQTVEILYRGASRDVTMNPAGVGSIVDSLSGSNPVSSPVSNPVDSAWNTYNPPTTTDSNRLVNPPPTDTFSTSGSTWGTSGSNVPIRPVSPPSSDNLASLSTSPTTRPTTIPVDRVPTTSSSSSQDWAGISSQMDQLERLRRELLQDRKDFELEKLKLSDRERELEQRAQMTDRLSGLTNASLPGGTSGSKSDLHDRLDALERHNSRLHSENKQLSSYLDHLEGNHRLPGQGASGTHDRWTDRLTPNSSSRPGLEGLQASVSGPGHLGGQHGGHHLGKDPDREVRNEKNVGVLYSLLIGSLGLNLYLAWISRSFYTRYGELADELRETFASTN
jgi:hypothetical protein